jgi:hypothetical protein
MKINKDYLKTRNRYILNEVDNKGNIIRPIYKFGCAYLSIGNVAELTPEQMDSFDESINIIEDKNHVLYYKPTEE